MTETKAIYRNAENPDLTEVLPLNKAANVISTLTDVKTNIGLMRLLGHQNFEGRIALTTKDEVSAEMLREAGANYILEPYKDSAQGVAALFKRKAREDAYRKKGIMVKINLFKCRNTFLYASEELS